MTVPHESCSRGAQSLVLLGSLEALAAPVVTDVDRSALTTVRVDHVIVREGRVDELPGEFGRDEGLLGVMWTQSRGALLAGVTARGRRHGLTLLGRGGERVVGSRVHAPLLLVVSRDTQVRTEVSPSALGNELGLAARSSALLERPQE